ncbi:MAG TPA: DNA translocase FtsK 4TM domain-containing protein, partial [Rhizomicrobium sp.]|nr:DNA translocase FtsK 4TM domain-containing protein [Rhizomicrobium sp.]
MSPNRMAGVYQPRSRRAAFSDALADARRTLARALGEAVLRGAGALLFLGIAAALVALATYNSADPSLNNATWREPTNLLGPLGATAADILLQTFGFAALAFLAPPAVWGIRALTGHVFRDAVWRAIAWPLGTLFVAAGLGAWPAPLSLPAGAGGTIGIAAFALASNVAKVYHADWISYAMLTLLLVAGLPLAFLATGLRFAPIARSLVNIPAFALWFGALVHSKQSEFRARREPSARDHDH